MSDGDAGRRFIANAIIAVGALIMVLCGGCTVWWLGMFMLSWSPGSTFGTFVSMLAIPLFVGGPPTIIGVALFVTGRRMKRRATPTRRRDVDSIFS